MPFIPPPYPSSRCCPCGVEVPLRFLVSTDPRNAGRPYYECANCNWHRWGDGLGGSPTTLPTTSQVLGVQPVPLPAPQTGHFVTDKRCRYPRCMLTRVSRKCQRHMCRKHCRISGGCTSQDHTSNVPRRIPANPDPALLYQPSSGLTPVVPPHSISLSISKTDRGLQPPSTLPNIVQDSQPPFPSMSSSNSSSLSWLQPPAQVSSSLLSASDSSASQSSSLLGPILSSTSSSFQNDSHPTPTPPSTTVPTTDPSISPRYTTKLSPIFAEHDARVHERADQQRQHDEEMKRVRESVFAFSYPEDDMGPVIVNFQDGFTYPYFKLTRSVLLDLELIDLRDQVAFHVVHYFNPELDVWVKMKVDSVIELTKPSQKLFFKATYVTSYPSFDHYLEATTATTYPHVPNCRIALSEERRYVRQQIIVAKAHKLEPEDELWELPSKKEIDDLARPPKHTMTPIPPMLDLQSNLHLAREKLEDGPIVHAGSTARLVSGIDRSLARFPSTFYATDVHTAFCFKGRGGLTMKIWFENFFQLPWKSSTYYDHKARWFSAPQDARDQAVAAGYMDIGQYSLFLAAHPAKDADAKATRRRMLAAQRSGILFHS